MMVKLIALTVALLATAGSCLATPAHHHSSTAADHVVLHARTSVPAGWTRGVRAVGSSPVSFTLALAQRNLDILDKWFTEASDPQHRNYQEYKSIDEIRDLVSPKPADELKVTQWLRGAGVHAAGIKYFGDAIDVETTVKHAETLFGTHFHEYTHGETNATIVRQFGEYGVHASVKSLVEMVVGISTFPVPHLKNQVNARNRANMDDTDGGITPAALDELYQISQSHRKMISKARGRGAAATTSLGVIQFEEQSFSPDDLTSYGQALNMKVQAVPASQIIGPNDPTNPGDESTMDIEIISGMNLVASPWFWLEAGSGWLYTFATHFSNTADVPQVASMSYGWREDDQCHDGIGGGECAALGVNAAGYVARVNTEFQKIGLRGVSLIVSSGDSGANGRTDFYCSDSRLHPAFPASSPYVTAVGGTETINTQPLPNPPPICTASSCSCGIGGTEQSVSDAVSGFASGGGFSDFATMPSYQQKAVNSYLKSGVALPPSSYFNSTNRAYPDVAAIGHNVMIISQGTVTPGGGTSASTPIFASIVAMLNAFQIAKNGKTLGFLNPFLYQMAARAPGTFHDITIGDNKCTEKGCSPSCQGYLASPGWDPVTGLGTPNVAAMLNFLKAQ